MAGTVLPDGVMIIARCFYSLEWGHHLPIGEQGGSLSEAFIYIGSALAVIWGAAHLAATRSVVNGFGEISRDNRLIITQEWIAEGVAMIFVGVLAVLVTAIEGPGDPVSLIVYRASAGVLVILATLTAATGARTPIVPFKICPFLLTIVAALFVVGSFL
jgi:hypothetical protein